MIDRIFKFFSSLRLTVVLLTCALILVFVGTLAQVRLGLYVAQAEYFRSIFIYWQPKGASWKIPILPGGWLLGGLLLLNLIAAHVKRFQFSKKKIGIFTIHAGLIFLLLGQFFTEVFQVESNIRFEEGETRNYSEDSRHNELAIIDVSDAKEDKVYSIPETLLAKGGEIRDPKLPFAVRIKRYFENSQPAGPMSGNDENKIKGTHDDGSSLWFTQAPIIATMDSRNVPSALVEFVSDAGVIGGEKIASLWIDQSQTIQAGGRIYKFALRSIRYYKPYTLTLLDFRHDKYAGTEIPSNFSSKVHLSDPAHGEDRDVLIRMNEPLRYRGETFFQASFDPNNDKVTVLQVVKNPAALTPYIACTLVGLGLLIQFLMHLVEFGRRRAGKISPQKTSKPVALPAEKGVS